MREEDFEAPLPHRHQEVQGCISAKTMWSNDSEWSNGCAVLILKAIVCHALQKQTRRLSVQGDLCEPLPRLSKSMFAKPLPMEVQSMFGRSSFHTKDRKSSNLPASQLYSQAIKYLAWRHTFHWEMHNRPSGPLILCSPARTYQLYNICEQVTCWPSDLLSLLRGEQRMEPVLAPEDRHKTKTERFTRHFWRVCLNLFPNKMRIGRLQTTTKMRG